jgi:opacity protein-like surface antigen
LFCVSIILSQTVTDDYYSPSKRNFFSEDKVVTSLSMGTSVGFLNSTKSPAITTFIAPKIGYQLSPKFQLNIGLMHYTLAGNTFMPVSNHEALFNQNSNSISGNLFFVEGQYKINKKFIASGSVIMNANSFNNQNNYKAVSLGLSYKVTEHSFLGISVEYSQRKGNPYFNNNDKTNPYYFGSANNGMFRSIDTGGIGQLGAQGLNSIFR